jgi:hypothetical protein
LKEFLVSVLEWWYEDIRPLFLRFADGQCCCHDRVVEGPMSPLMMTFLLGCRGQIPVIEDYPYAGIDFSRDPEIPVPPGEERGEMGKFASFFFF